MADYVMLIIFIARFGERQDQQPREPNFAMEEQGNLSTSTLRRKLFEGHIDSSDSEEEQEKKESGNKDDVLTAKSIIGDTDDQLMSSPIRQDFFSPEHVPLTPISKMAKFGSKNVSNHNVLLNLFISSSSYKRAF